MRVLGLCTGVDCGAAIVENGRILAAINEERLCRLKLADGFPRGSIREVLRLTATAPEQLDAVLVAAERERFVDGLQPFPGWFQNSPEDFVGRVKHAAGKLSHHRERFPFLESGYYALLTPSFSRRRRGIRRILHGEFELHCPIRFVDHHFAHITSAYLTSGFDDALVVSVDGGGDGKSSRVYSARAGHLESLHDVSAYNSLGNYYAYVTHICGFKAQKHEGKITGLAAHGEPRYLPLLGRFIDERDGTFLNLGGVVFLEAIQTLSDSLPRGWKREDLAASIQQHFEELTRRYIGHWLERSGQSNVALAGGVFSNVRVNQEVHELAGVKSVFVHPGMGDGGLAVGAALAACVPGVLARTMVCEADPLADVYLGPTIEESDIDAALRAEDLTPEPLAGPIEERIAEVLVEGCVVARAAGRMEYGPRALGNRSILYQPTDHDVNDWLNRMLNRTEFMPFAPVVMTEQRARCFEHVDGATHTAEFMTITFDCTPWMSRHLSGVVHVDGTARPQLIRKEQNASYYRILEAFHRRTGLPGFINTSFNMHEEPIVCSATDCVRAFLASGIDYLAIGDLLVKHPAGVAHPVKPVQSLPMSVTADSAKTTDLAAVDDG